ncbi:MAG: branched-chain amino acid ABC transporter permease [Thermodesulfobacteriota bacterium]
MTGQLNQIIVNAISIGAIYALLALGLTLLFSVMDILFFAHGAMYMFGAYATYYLCTALGLNYLLALPLTIAGIGLLGVLIEKGLLRPIRSQHVAVLFLALGLNSFFESLGLMIFGLKPKNIGTVFPGRLHLGEAIFSWERFAVVLIALAAVAGLYLFLNRTRLGLGMRAFADDPVAAELQGISNDTVCSLGFLIGCGLAALAGLLVAPIFILTPTMGSHAVLIALLTIGLGGLGSIPGALVAAFVIGVIESFGTSFLGADITWGLIFIFVVVFLVIRPTGIMGVARE